MTDVPVESAPADSTPARLSLLPSLAIAMVVVIADVLTKRWAVTRLSHGRTIHILGSLQFNLTYNSGMAFSRGRGVGPYIGVIAVVVVTLLLVSLRQSESRLGSIATGMVIGGAVGNILDRLFRGDGWFKGLVVDFIDPQWFPIFNVADIGVTVGGFLLVAGTMWYSRTTRLAPPDRRTLPSHIRDAEAEAASDDH